MTALRVVIADDERPARQFLANVLNGYDDIELVGEAASGIEAVHMIEKLRPDLALLDLQMPEVGGLEVMRMVRREFMPLIAFVTAYDEYAVDAFELAAIDYLLKPVEPARLRLTLSRAIERLEESDFRRAETDRVLSAVAADEYGASSGSIRRIPIRRKDDVIFVPVEQVASIVAKGESLAITTGSGEHHQIVYRLKDLEAKLDPHAFIRISRGCIVNIGMIRSVTPMTGGTYVVVLSNAQRLAVSRLRARIVRNVLLRL